MRNINDLFHWDMNFTLRNVGLIKEKAKRDITLLLLDILRKAIFHFLEATQNMVICLGL